MKKSLTVTAAVALLVGLGTAAPAQAAPGFAFDQRISGADRFATAVAASKLLEPTDGSATDVVVVNGYATVDGLTASYLAGLRSAPILYTDTGSVPAVTAAEIDRLGADDVWIVGGTNRVPQAQQDAWAAAGKTVHRIAGADRYETAALVAEADDSGDAPEQVFIASGTGTADALAAGPVAWARNYPILLTDPASVPAATAAALGELGTTNRVVLGGSITDAVYGQLGGTERIAGASRQETAAKVADDAIANENFDPQSVALVGGTDATAVDALAAAPVAGSQGVPLLFTGFDGGVGEGTSAYLTAHRADYAGTGWVFGGEPSVSQATADAASALAR
ncbi:cell wall-binding repeat-containing protein [Kineococcus aurantiacus]|uniref:Putative cell wall-binding protein n=1 Tax=Kineococcus aurantiacus TaxID=37633 RepID=A0A7Y9DKY5_9ACTN|nr:cell wall-binding repeat-containing protein [Kineococcus aurantiacus]NYD22513.1 putative cell wall-binding protein [Kineococcus aurantiacus]